MEGNGVQQYYEAIRNRLSNYIKSDYLANSETLLTYVDALLELIFLENRILKHQLRIKKPKTELLNHNIFLII